MKFLMLSIGSRGDVEPFVAVAELLRNNGHAVVCSFPEQYRFVAEDNTFEFHSLGPKFLELLETEDGKLIMSGGGHFLKKLGAYRRMYYASAIIQKDLIERQKEIIAELKPDRIIYSGKAMYPLFWSITNSGKAIMLSPVPNLLHPTKKYPHIGFKKNFGALNGLTYKLANFGLMQNAKASAKKMSEQMSIGFKELKKVIFGNKTIYSISPSLFSEPKEWPEHAKVLGYYERAKDLNWKPSPELTTFISKHPKLLLVTFGSMINNDPQGKTKTFLDALRQRNIPAIINTSSGGLIKPDSYNNELFHFTNRIPYDWVFPKIYGVIHHGGSGTTHTALKNGCASLIVPHIIDQFFWNQLVAEKEVGPKGPSIKELNSENFSKALDALWNTIYYKKNAEQISQQMQQENLEVELLDFLTTPV